MPPTPHDTLKGPLEPGSQGGKNTIMHMLIMAALRQENAGAKSNAESANLLPFCKGRREPGGVRPRGSKQERPRASSPLRTIDVTSHQRRDFCCCLPLHELLPDYVWPS